MQGPNPAGHRAGPRAGPPHWPRPPSATAPPRRHSRGRIAATTMRVSCGRSSRSSATDRRTTPMCERSWPDPSFVSLAASRGGQGGPLGAKMIEERGRSGERLGVSSVEWTREGETFSPPSPGEPDSLRAFRPWVLEEESGALHMATSSEGHEWVAHGTIMQRGDEDALGAAHPCLVITGEPWWLFFSGYDGQQNGRRAAVLGAVSPSGASWDRIGTVLEPAEDELAVSHPCVLEIARTLYMFYASDDGTRVSIALATSTDGISWERLGTTLGPGEGPDGLSAHSPCALRLNDGSIRMWYSGLPVGDTDLAYRICSARFPGSWSS